MKNKSNQVRELLMSGNTAKALSVASTFRLGDPKLLKAVKLGHDANQNPRFYEQIKKDPVQLIAQGAEALRQLVGAV